MSIYTNHKPNAGSGNYLKLKDGDRKKVRFASEPAVVTYDGEKLRYQWVVYNKSDGLAQTYEAGAMVFGQLAELYEDWGEPTEFDCTISRTGSGQFDTSYTVTPSPKSVDLTTAELSEVDAIEFPSSKARMLEDVEKDGKMPETIEVKNKATNQSEEEVPLPDVPPEFQ